MIFQGLIFNRLAYFQKNYVSLKRKHIFAVR